MRGYHFLRLSVPAFVCQPSDGRAWTKMWELALKTENFVALRESYAGYIVATFTYPTVIHGLCKAKTS